MLSHLKTWGLKFIKENSPPANSHEWAKWKTVTVFPRDGKSQPKIQGNQFDAGIPAEDAIEIIIAQGLTLGRHPIRNKGIEVL